MTAPVPPAPPAELRPAHTFADHTADVRLHVEAPTLAALFEEAGRALGELMGGGAAGPLGPAVTARAEAPDTAALLVRWIDELVFLSETRHRVWTDVHVVHLDGGVVEGTLRGPAVEALRTAVKAATFHDLHVDAVDGGFRARLVLDV